MTASAYEVIVFTAAERQLKQLHRKQRQLFNKICGLIRQLSADPTAPPASTLEGDVRLPDGLGTLWKRRVGDYRILYVVQEAHRRIILARVGHRSDVYDNLDRLTSAQIQDALLGPLRRINDPPD